MLKREPSHRVKLDEILAHSWLSSDEMEPPQTTPLVCRENISEEVHSHIVQKMVDGRIVGRKDEVTRSVSRSGVT